MEGDEAQQYWKTQNEFEDFLHSQNTLCSLQNSETQSVWSPEALKPWSLEAPALRFEATDVNSSLVYL